MPTCEPTPELATEPTTQKQSKLKLQQGFMNEIIADEKDINDEIFWNYFKHLNPSFLAKKLIRTKQSKNERLVNNMNDKLIDLRNAIIKKENENENKIVDTVEKILNLNKQQKSTLRPRRLASLPSDLILRSLTVRSLTVCNSKY